MGVNKVNYGSKVLIDLTGDTVTAESLLKGYTAHNAAGEAVSGAAVIPTKTSELENDSGFVTDTDLSGYLPLSGGTLTGNLTGKYITGTRLQTTQVSDKVGKFATIDNQGWIYYRTADEALADMGGAKVIKGTADLTAGTSALADGEIYLCYE